MPPHRKKRYVSEGKGAGSRVKEKTGDCKINPAIMDNHTKKIPVTVRKNRFAAANRASL